MDFKNWEKLFSEKVKSIATEEDPAHDFLHFQRVVKSAKRIAEKENAKLEVVIPAAWLHDLVIVPKNDLRRSIASRLSALEAKEFLNEIHYPKEYLEEIVHAIEVHSFSANLETKTLEAKVVQDADRLDGLGAIGIARCFATAGVLKRPFYAEEDSFCDKRSPDDRTYTVDHFYAKLFKVAETLKTNSGREEGRVRLEIMKSFLKNLSHEIAF
ncbi:MAG: HD domain-containing protein [Oligoflexia bacterium]|nr:HD domain-containing protein [Oligoflexia bacterium]